MGELSPVHLIAVLVIALIVLGPGRLPEAAAGIGHAIRDFRKALDEKDEDQPPGPDQPAS